MKNKSEIEFEPWSPPPRCDNRRVKRGKIACEKPQSMYHEEHAGRGSDGRWFFWDVGTGYNE